MFDACGKIIYVGQSHDLRERIGSYRYIHPDRSGRKLVRLVHNIADIRWETCTTAEAARVRENSLLREHRPKFNSINKWPRAHWFATIRSEEERLHCTFTREEPPDNANIYGAFKSGCLIGYTSLLRLVWAVLNQTISVHAYPRQLIAEKPPKEFTFPLTHSANSSELREQLLRFFTGESFTIVDWFAERLPAADNFPLFDRNLFLTDLEQLRHFFQFGPARNAKLRKKHGLQKNLIGQEALDDLLVS